MSKHILLPNIELVNLKLVDVHADWLSRWLYKIEEDIEKGVLSTSVCLQGMIVEKLLNNKCLHNWVELIETYLISEDDEKPLAYSRGYGEKLYKYSQWKQSPVHAVHTHWWIKREYGVDNLQTYNDFIRNLIQPNGWIYNPNVSCTNIRTRMKSELMLSIAMGIEILNSNKSLGEKESFESTIVSLNRTPFLGAEYFRIRALEELVSLNLIPANLNEIISECVAGKGYCDFSVNFKVDDYMGTKKRVSRDKAVHSALSGLHAHYIASKCNSKKLINDVENGIKDFAEYLKKNPFDIPAFKMRDIDVPFGTDLSPIEVIAASYIITNWG